MSTSYFIIHVDGLALHFTSFEQAAAWVASQPAHSKLASLFLAFIESPFDGEAFAAITGDAMVRMTGGWTFTASFYSGFNPVIRRDQVQLFAYAMDYSLEVAAATLSQLGYQVDIES